MLPCASSRTTFLSTPIYKTYIFLDMQIPSESRNTEREEGGISYKKVYLWNIGTTAQLCKGYNFCISKSRGRRWAEDKDFRMYFIIWFFLKILC